MSDDTSGKASHQQPKPSAVARIPQRERLEDFSATSVLVSALATTLFEKTLFPFPFNIALPHNKAGAKEKSLEEKKAILVKQLMESQIDPKVFDSLLSNEIDRRLKVRFGVTFLCLTFIFTAASYAIVVLNAVYKWGISEVAISALIIQAPIQLIGLLLIIARNLFPQGKNTEKI